MGLRQLQPSIGCNTCASEKLAHFARICVSTNRPAELVDVQAIRKSHGGIGPIALLGNSVSEALAA